MIEPVLIPLRTQDGSVKTYASVDPRDAALVNRWRWHLTSNGYVARGVSAGGRQTVLLHRFLMGLEKSDPREVDHFNLDRLDNRRSNLRVTTKAENRQNVASRRGSSSRFRGVGWAKQQQCWTAFGGINGKKYHLGLFESEVEAAAVAASWRAKNLPYSSEASS